MKVARVLITPELLCQMLHFPDGTVLGDVRMDTYGGGGRYVALLVEHKDLKDAVVTVATGPPKITPHYERRGDAVVFVGWGQ